ncbi:hypothetical protein PG637_07860 [Riemerella anatipestifer]|uniref:hypothetical protein n=1 Tax=Riemerella anatipestifer TaxID=34085 RepID=UPI00069CBDE6|nr:hypothetical protein [Riemerella anatipestifer]MDY3319206.1 hypothetical protein [Riemerella anatipestifer]MDY3325578.1 hypothetical protein [Riemerella anatipestifer]MDY3354019.1 hypothetical protein [Riemerella anatipestifer]
MKKILLAVFLMATVTVGKAQSILGKYEQSALDAPDEYKHSEDDVVITRDAKASKKIWIANLIPNSRFYAILDTKGERGSSYSVPKQTAGSYRINLGCIVFNNDDEDGGRLTISLNNKADCLDDYGPVSVGKDGVSVGGIKIGSNGTVRAKGVDIGRNRIKVDAKKEVIVGIQYIGHKK